MHYVFNFLSNLLGYSLLSHFAPHSYFFLNLMYFYKGKYRCNLPPVNQDRGWLFQME